MITYIFRVAKILTFRRSYTRFQRLELYDSKQKGIDTGECGGLSALCYRRRFFAREARRRRISSLVYVALFDLGGILNSSSFRNRDYMGATHRICILLTSLSILVRNAHLKYRNIFANLAGPSDMAKMHCSERGEPNRFLDR